MKTTDLKIEEEIPRETTSEDLAGLGVNGSLYSQGQINQELNQQSQQQRLDQAMSEYGFFNSNVDIKDQNDRLMTDYPTMGRSKSGLPYDRTRVSGELVRKAG